MATSKRGAELLNMTLGIEPTRNKDEREKRHQAEPKVAAVAMGRDLVGLGEATKRAEQAEAELLRVLATTRAALGDLYEIPGRRRKLTADDYAALKANIAQHGLLSPVTVESREGGGWNIVSGHHRVDALRELGLKDAPIHVLQAGQDADEKAFYANLLHKSLPAFERYQGLKRIQTEKNLNQEQLAQYTGLSKSTISDLLAFDKLPADAHEVIAANPVVGTRTAPQLATLPPEAVKQAVIAMVNGLDQSEAIRLAKIGKLSSASNSKSETPTKPQPNTETFRQGKKTMCTARLTGSTLRLDFANELELAATVAAIFNVLREHYK